MTNKSFDSLHLPEWLRFAHANYILPRRKMIETHPFMVKMQNGSAEKQHGENGYLLLKEFVSLHDTLLQQQCVFYIDQLSASMAYGLLESGLRRWN